MFGPYEDAQKQVLKILADNYDDLHGKAGEEQARGLLDLFIKTEKLEKADSEPIPDSQPLEEATAPNKLKQPDKWRLTGLQCESYRGSGPPGETIEFPFDGRSTLIYGPNGSGKSSLLGAVVWALTGTAITDSVDEVTQVPLHKPSAKGEKKGLKIREWPVAATLPEKDPKSVTETCRVELELSYSDGSRKLFVRRTLADGLQVKEEKSQTWKACSNLSDYGISPLDLQLSLIAPSVFGRLTVESAQNSGQLLSLMLGLDDVENIGKLAAAIARNRTALTTKTINKKDQAWEKLLESIKGPQDGLKQTSESRKILEELIVKEKPSLDEIKDAGKTIEDLRDGANQSIAKVLGYHVDDGDYDSDEKGDKGAKQVPESLAESLRAAVVELKKGVETCLPVLNSINPYSLWDKETGSDSGDWLKLIDKSLENFFDTTRNGIGARLDWLRQKDKTGPKADLLLHASGFYNDQTDECPVCEETIKKEKVKSHLREFKNLDSSLLKEIDDFFRDLRHQLDKIVSQKIQALAAQSPSKRLLNDWAALKNELGADLAPIANNYDELIDELTEGITLSKTDPLNLMPSDAEKEFAESAEEFLNACSESRVAIGLLKWASEHLSMVNVQLSKYLTDTKGDSLLSVLSKGVNAAEDVRELERIKKVLAEAYKTRKDIAYSDEIIAALERLKIALVPLKDLEKNALEIVRNEFDNIKEDTLNNWDQLYPEHTTGLSPANLFLEGTKDRKVYSYLGHLDYEVAGQYFANAGLQRAIALSFFFALLGRHPKGLGFVVMDDSIASLDEDHRDQWSGNILKPCMDQFQFIFATHQKVYLKYHGDTEFSGKLIVELNRRKNGGLISWKPGHRIERAISLIKKDPDLVPNSLRKFIEELLFTFETYSDTPFVDKENLPQSIKNYGESGPPLQSNKQAKIYKLLSGDNLVKIVNAGSHGPTDHEITEPMIAKQLKILKECWQMVEPEIKRLEDLRFHDLRKRTVKNTSIKSPDIPTPANWDQPLTFVHIGRAAAKEDSVYIDATEEPAKFKINNLSPILVTGNTLDPVAKKGQWVLLCPDDESITDGCLAAVLTSDGNHLLRRVWSGGDDWLLQSINPVDRIAVKTASIETTTVRKIAGVVFEPRQEIDKEALSSGAEWRESKILTPDDVSRFNLITVEGKSLEPIAWKGQSVLIGESASVSTSNIHRGSLAVLETKDSNVGNVIKRVFPSDDSWILVSPNPVDPHDPIIVDCSDIERVYPFRGVIFETKEFA